LQSNGSRFSLVFGRSLGRVVVDIHGELDAASAGQLTHGLRDLIEGQGNRQIVLDLRGMTLIDPSGLAVLVDAHKRIQRNAGSLVLSGASPEMMRAFEAAGLANVFNFTPAWAHPAHGDGRLESGRSADLGA
jgi:anti-anti-sigma factor